MAWISLEKELPPSLEEASTLSYILPFICYQIDITPEGVEHQLASVAETTGDSRQPNFFVVTKLIEESKAVIVFDNAELLLEKDLQEVKGLVVHLLDTVKKGKVVLICKNSYAELSKCLNSQESMDRIPEDETHSLEIPKIRRDEASKILSETFEIENPERVGGVVYDPTEVVQAAYLLKNNSQLELKGRPHIQRLIAVDLDTIREESLFVSLFNGTNSVDFYESIQKPKNTPNVLEKLSEMGLLVLEKNHFRIHTSIAEMIKDRYKNLYDKNRSLWHASIGEAYHEVAKKHFHLRQILEAFRHYSSMPDFGRAVRLFQDRDISSEMRNWGHHECLERWLKQLYEEEISPCDRFAIDVLFLQLERHELKFDRLAKIKALDELSKQQGDDVRARYLRTVGEMFLAKRDYDNAQRYLDKACRIIQGHISTKENNDNLLIEARIEYSRIILRIAELLVYKGMPKNAQKFSELIQEEIKKGLSYVAKKTALTELTIDHPYISDYVHQLSVANSINAQACLEMQNYAKARICAIRCIKLSIFCRSYPTGDVLGRVIGHIYYAMAISKNKELHHDVSWHIKTINYLLYGRKVRETWWFTMALLVLALSKGETEDFDSALSTVDTAFGLLARGLLPDDMVFDDRWKANPEKAKEHSGWKGQEEPDNDDYEFHRLKTMSDGEFARSFPNKDEGLTDPWREAELFWARSRIFRKKLQALTPEQRLEDNEDNPGLTNYLAESNAGKFAAYLGYVLARKYKYMSLMAKLLREVSYIYYLDNSDPNSYTNAIELMKDCVELTSRTDSTAVLVLYLRELADMILSWKSSPDIGKCYQALSALYEALAYCKKDNIRPKTLSDRIEEIYNSESLKDYDSEQIAEMTKQRGIKFELNKRRFDRLPFNTEVTIMKRSKIDKGEEGGEGEVQEKVMSHDMSIRGASLVGNANRIRALINEAIRVRLEDHRGHHIELPANAVRDARFEKMHQSKNEKDSTENVCFGIAFSEADSKRELLNQFLYRKL